MLFHGSWFLAPDRVLRPIIKAYLFASDGSSCIIPFMVDSGADRTVFSAEALDAIGIEWPEATDLQLEGVGGRARVVNVDLAIYLTREMGNMVRFNGPYLGFPEPNDLEISILGRDLLNNFAVILDRKKEVVLLVAPNHTYSIQEP